MSVPSPRPGHDACRNHNHESVAEGVLHSHQEPDSSLWQEVNALRKPEKTPVKDADELEREKLNNTCFGKIAGSKKFEYTTLGVIVFNAGFIGYDADFAARNGKPDDLYVCGDFRPDACYQFIIAENFFAVYFTMEVFVRFWAYRRKCSCFTDLWFLFDSTLVMFMVAETWVLPIFGGSGALSQLSVLRLLRLLRITRMAKLMRFFPELQIIVKGMLAAVRSVICTAILLIMILYVWAIIFTAEYHQGDVPDTEVEGEVRQLFGSMLKSMRHLFIMGTILDDITLCTNFIRSSGKMPWPGPDQAVLAEGAAAGAGLKAPAPQMLAFFILFVLLSSFTMLNMLIGILCEVVCATGEGERQKNTEMGVREAITTLFHKMDKDSNGEITREEFLSMKTDRTVMKALKALDVKAKHFEMYADLMFKPEDEGGDMPTFDFEETINMIMRLRPGTKVSSLDFASFQMTVQKNHDSLAKHVYNIERMAGVLTGKEFVYDPTKQEGGEEQQPSKEEPSNEPEPAAKIMAGTLPQIQMAPDQDILAELQRRIGSFSGVEAWPEK